jgi:hypothetical protein
MWKNRPIAIRTHVCFALPAKHVLLMRGERISVNVASYRTLTTYVFGSVSCNPLPPAFRKVNASKGINRQNVRPRICPVDAGPPVAPTTRVPVNSLPIVRDVVASIAK